MSRCAVYARYSTDRQNPASIQDQIRKCSEYAVSRGWLVAPEHVYPDEALSGVGDDRPEFTRMMTAATSQPRPFDVLLVDDTSRISRNLSQTARVFERLNFAGVRILAVSQGIDSRDEQADVLFTVHGLVDSLYVKELAKKTHRGLDSRVLKGLHAGGRTFGYSNVKGDDGVRLEVNEAEAPIVRRIFEMSASGLSLKTIAKTFNAEKIPSPRPRAGKQYSSWAPTCLRAMLHNELYAGTVIWNRSRWIKAPGTNRRLRRERPETEWRRAERPDLRVVSQDLWKRVHDRQAWLKETYSTEKRPGLLNRAAVGRYLLSGLMRCGVCGAQLVIVTGRKGHRPPQYGCPQNFYRGTCTNNLKESQDWLERELLSEIRRQVLRPEAIDYFISELGRQMRSRLSNLSEELAQLRGRKVKLEAEIGNLTAAVAESGHSPALLRAIAQREDDLRSITDRLLSEGEDSIEKDLAGLKALVTERIDKLEQLIGISPTDGANEPYQETRARRIAMGREELRKHLRRAVTMEPDSARRHYIAKGGWDILGELRPGSWDGCGGWI